MKNVIQCVKYKIKLQYKFCTDLIMVRKKQRINKVVFNGKLVHRITDGLECFLGCEYIAESLNISRGGRREQGGGSREDSV